MGQYYKHVYYLDMEEFPIQCGEVMDSDRFFRSFGRNVAQRRKELDVTQEVLAQRLSLSRPSITNIERGEQGVSLYMAIQIARALELEDVNMLIPRMNEAVAMSPIELNILEPADGITDAARRQVERIWNDVGNNTSS